MDKPGLYLSIYLDNEKGDSYTQPTECESQCNRQGPLVSPNAGRARRATVEGRLLLRHVPALDLVGLRQGLPRVAEHLTLLRNRVLLASGLATTKKPSLAERTGAAMREGERGQGQGQRVERAFHSARLSAQNCMYGLFFFLPIADLGAISAQGSRSGGTQHRVRPRKDFATICRRLMLVGRALTVHVKRRKLRGVNHTDITCGRIERNSLRLSRLLAGGSFVHTVQWL